LQAEKQGLWVREATRLRVVQGNFGSVDNLWMDDKTEAAHRETEFAKWRVVAFKCFNVWLAVLVCGWPGMSIASTLKVLGFSKLATHTIAVTIAVAVVVFVAVPLTQVCRPLAIQYSPLLRLIPENLFTRIICIFHIYQSIALSFSVLEPFLSFSKCAAMLNNRADSDALHFTCMRLA
jgi:hypothetical protein